MDVTTFKSIVTSGSHSINIPSRPGKDVLLIAHSPAIMTKPSADWIDVFSTIADMHTVCWKLPASKNSGGISTFNVGLSVPYTMCAVVLQDYGISTGYAAIAQRNPVGSAWGTGAHTFSAMRAIAVFGTGADGTVNGNAVSSSAGSIIADTGSSSNPDGNGNVRLWLVEVDNYNVVADGIVLSLDATLASTIVPNRCNSGFLGFSYDPNGGGSIVMPSKADSIMNELVNAGYTTGTVLDRERARLLDTLELTAPQNLSLQDLYFLAEERPRLF